MPRHRLRTALSVVAVVVAAGTAAWAVERPDPLAPGQGRVALQLAGPPESGPEAVVLRLAGPETRDVLVRTDEALEIDLAPGTYAVTTERGGTCPRRLEAAEGEVRRADLLWPCDAPDLEPSPPAPPG